MVRPVARQRTVAGKGAAADEFEAPIRGRCDIVRIEIDETGLVLHAVGIMTRRARGLLIDDVESMTAILARRIHRTKTLIGQDAAPAMAFVAKVVR